jgi:hypothetical protein
MEQAPQKRWGKFGQVVAASVALHLVVAAALFLRLPTQTPAQPEEAVNVELVPPPEDKKPEEKKPEEKKPEEKAAEPPPPEKQPEKAPEPPAAPPPPPKKAEDAGQQPPPPPQEKAEEKTPEPPPPPKAPEKKPPEPPKEAKAEELPKPPEKPSEPPKPPEPPKEAKAEEPPKTEDQPKPSEQKPEDTAKQEQAKSQISPMRPVYQFGDKDSGPKESKDGDAAEQSDTAEETQSPDQPTDPAEAQPSASETTDKPVEDAAASAPIEEDINLPQVGAQDMHSERDGPASADDGEMKASLTTENPKGTQADPKGRQKQASAKSQANPDNNLKRAKKLYSESDTDDKLGQTTMDGVPRDIRGGELCATELQEQLEHAPGGYHPDLVLKYRMPPGTILQPSKSQFRAQGQWYNLQFRCELDAGITKVVSFTYDVGSPIPRSEWKSRGFPEN